MSGYELQDPKKISTICVQNLESFVKKMNSTKSLALGMKPKYSIKEKNLELVKAEGYPRLEVLPKHGLCRYLHEQSKKHRDQKQRPTNFM